MSDLHKKTEEIMARIKPKPLPWQNFEKEVTAYISHEIDFCNFGLNPATARVLSHPQDYSKLRETHITFDASIELWPFPNAERPTIIWLWECKDYPTRNVSVDEVEEFHDKITQVGAHKGTIVTRKGFCTSAITLAKSYGIALVVLEKEQIALFAFSQNAGIIDRVVLKSPYCLYSFGNEVSGAELNTLVIDEFTKDGLMNW